MVRYTLHNILTFDIVDNRKNKIWRYDVSKRYQAINNSLSRLDPPDLLVEIGPFTPSLSGCNILDEELFVKPNYLYVLKEKHKLGSWWNFDVTGLDEDRVKVRVHANSLGMLFVPGGVIDFFIHYLLTKRGFSLLHASAIAFDGRAAIFAARGGGGKTMIALTAMKHKNIKYLGDNFIVCKSGKVYSFISDLNVFGYNLQTSVWNRLSKLEKLRFNLWLRVYDLSKGYIKVFTQVSPSRLFPDQLEESADLAMLFSIMTRSGTEFNLTIIDRSKFISRLLSNIRLEFFSFTHYTDLYGCLYPSSYFAQHWSNNEKLLYENLPQNVPCYEVTMPPKIEQENIEFVLKYLT